MGSEDTERNRYPNRRVSAGATGYRSAIGRTPSPTIDPTMNTLAQLFGQFDRSVGNIRAIPGFLADKTLDGIRNSFQNSGGLAELYGSSSLRPGGEGVGSSSQFPSDPASQRPSYNWAGGDDAATRGATTPNYMDAINAQLQDFLAGLESETAAAELGYMQQMRSLEQGKTQLQEQYDFRVKELTEAQTQITEVNGYRSDVLDAELSRLEASYGQSLQQFALQEKALGVQMARTQEDLASTTRNAIALQEENAKAIGRVSSLRVDDTVDTAPLEAVAAQGQADIASTFDRQEAGARDMATSDLSEEALAAVDAIISADEGLISAQLKSMTDADLADLMAAVTSVARNFGAERDLSVEGLTSQAAVSDAGFSNKITGIEQSIEDLGLQGEGLALDKQGAALSFQQAKDMNAEDKTGLALSTSQSLRDWALSSEGAGLNFRHAMEDLNNGVAITEENFDQVMSQIRGQYADPKVGAGEFARTAAAGVLSDALGQIDPGALDVYLSMLDAVIVEGGLATGRDFRNAWQAAQSMPADELDPRSIEAVLANLDSGEAALFSKAIDAYDQGWQGYNQYFASPIGYATQKKGTEAPSNYENRYGAEYVQRKALTVWAADQLKSVFPSIKEIQGVNYYRPPSDEIGAGQSPNSDHQSAGALDVFADAATMRQVEAWAESQEFVSFAKYDTDAAHEDHVHISFLLGYAPPGSG